MNAQAADVAVLGAAALHAGFQLTVTTLVYPNFARVQPREWDRLHSAHSRGITPLVVLTYGALTLTGLWALRSEPNAATWAAAAAVAVTFALTAFLAAPAHGRLAQGYDEQLIAALLRADRARAVSAIAALAAAVVAVA